MGLAYNVDSYIEMSADHTEFSYMADVEQHHNDGSVDCDHCCHGLSHLTGITSYVNYSINAQPERFLIVYSQRLDAITHTPPTPPPTA